MNGDRRLAGYRNANGPRPLEPTVARSMTSRRIRIGIDARMEKPWPTGLGRYARGLCRALTALPVPRAQWVIVKHPTMAGVRFAAPGSDAVEKLVPGDLDTPRNLLSARELHVLGLDLYHSLHHFLPLGLRTPQTVVSLHDLIWVDHAHLTFDCRFAGFRSLGVRLFGTWAQRRTLGRADAVVSVSGASRAAALRRYSFLRPERVAIVHHGLDPGWFTSAPRRGTEPPFFLCLGNSKPYKNWHNALRALHIALHEVPEVRLVLAGRGDSYGNLARLIRELGIENHVSLRRVPSDAEVRELLQGARALVFPSLIEGFGLPPLEAMAAGCPVIASSIDVVHEVCGEAPLYVDPRDPGDIAAAMIRVLGDSEVGDELSRRGVRHAGGFSWERCATETLAVYRTLLGDALGGPAQPGGPALGAIEERSCDGG